MSWSKGLLCSGDSIIIGAGTEYLLQLAIKIIQKYGETAADTPSPANLQFLLEEPGYEKIRSIVADERCTVTGIPVDKEGIKISRLTSADPLPYSINAVYVTRSSVSAGNCYVFQEEKNFSHGLKTQAPSLLKMIMTAVYYTPGRILPALQSMDDNDRFVYGHIFYAL